MTAASVPASVRDGAVDAGPVVGLGEVLWDLLPDGPVCGGAPANAACQVAILGRPAAIASRVSADVLGDEAIRLLAARGVDCRCVQRGPTPPAGAATGTVDVSVDGQGRPTYVFARDPAWDHIEWTDGFESLAERAAAVVYGTLAQRATTSRRAIRLFLAATRRDCLRVFDVNLRQDFHTTDVVRDSLALCDVLKLNLEELPVVAAACGMTMGDDPASTLTRIVRLHDLSAAALTLGADGSVVVVGDNVSVRNARSVVVVDTVGAGDAFTAGMIVGLLAVSRDTWSHAEVVESVHDAAAAAAARACSHRGAMPP